MAKAKRFTVEYIETNGRFGLVAKERGKTIWTTKFEPKVDKAWATMMAKNYESQLNRKRDNQQWYEG